MQKLLQISAPWCSQIRLHGDVVHLMLYGMPAFMGGYADSCHRSGIVHTLRQPDHVAAGVIVVSQIAGDLFNANLIQTVVIQNLPCHLCRAVSPRLLRSF